jgi:hypothetical protein
MFFLRVHYIGSARNRPLFPVAEFNAWMKHHAEPDREIPYAQPTFTPRIASSLSIPAVILLAASIS